MATSTSKRIMVLLSKVVCSLRSCEGRQRRGAGWEPEEGAFGEAASTVGLGRACLARRESRGGWRRGADQKAYICTWMRKESDHRDMLTLTLSWAGDQPTSVISSTHRVGRQTDNGKVS